MLMILIYQEKNKGNRVFITFEDDEDKEKIISCLEKNSISSSLFEFIREGHESEVDKETVYILKNDLANQKSSIKYHYTLNNIDFWECTDPLNSNNEDFWNIGKDRRFTLSGRTAIYFCLKNITCKRKIERAYVPSYCCDSMIEPFLEFGIEIEYYSVYYDGGLKYDIEIKNNVDLFLAMNYFGYSNTNMDSYIKKFKEQGTVVLEDITHSLFSTKRFSKDSDYLVGSLRKWMPVLSGGIAVSMNSDFKLSLNIYPNEKMIETRNNAMKKKRQYILDGSEELKEKFLKEYKDSNMLLGEDYKDYSIDEKSFQIIQGIDITQIKSKRIENAKTIYEKMKGKVNFLIDDYNNEDALLAVPIMIDGDKRDVLRNYLKDKKVYLPVHWPLSDKRNNIYERELSLVCDQRYDKGQISEYLEYIIDFLNKTK